MFGKNKERKKQLILLEKQVEYLREQNEKLKHSALKWHAEANKEKEQRQRLEDEVLQLRQQKNDLIQQLRNKNKTRLRNAKKANSF